ncbi:Fe-S cluster assembly sulfur transfer protein SufU [uncultured Sphaerochaeta sp.]|uniref:Fe-S cluster assembly sulfur transfer protein SufU n=1 Tax=uncultured Sphaerochaeta sp. TaxID=886478 RepID=UPI002A0A22D9|nr:SUF system NifU family Fe-S cluster assembly protein [uncultured Sphaerochaeta sp.]
MNIDEMYRQVIMSHNASGRNKRHLVHPTLVQPGVNPSCGDEIALELEISPAGKLEDISFTGSGCAISQASVSIMADLVRSRELGEIRELETLFMDMIHSGTLDEDGAARLQEAAIFSTVSHMPARVKCAVLGWRTLSQALDSLDKAEKGGK